MRAEKLMALFWRREHETDSSISAKSGNAMIISGSIFMDIKLCSFRLHIHTLRIPPSSMCLCVCAFVYVCRIRCIVCVVLDNQRQKSLQLLWTNERTKKKPHQHQQYKRQGNAPNNCLFGPIPNCISLQWALSLLCFACYRFHYGSLRKTTRTNWRIDTP